MQVDYDNSTNVQRLPVQAVSPEDVPVIDTLGNASAASLGTSSPPGS